MPLDGDDARAQALLGPDHPLWLLEVQIEREMLEAGAKSFREAVAKAKAKGQMTSLRPVRRLLDEWVPKVTAGIRDWHRHSAKLRGVKPLALAYIHGADAELLSLLTLRTVLDALGTPRSKLHPLATRIGLRAEHELQVRAWERQDPDSFKSAQRYFDKEGSTPAHRARANLFLFHRELAAGRFAEGWEAWSRDAHFRVGVALLEVMVRSTGWFAVEEYVPEEGVPTKRCSPPRSPPLALAPKPGLLEWLAEELDREEVFRPLYMPTIIPPKPWTDTRNGGYWTPYIRTPDLIRFKASQHEQRAAAREEYAALLMPGVYDAVNFLQGCAWRINGRVLSILEAAREVDMGIGKLPSRTTRPLPPKPADIDTNEEALKVWKRAAKEVKRHNNSLYGRNSLVSGILKAARAYAPHERICFPHMLDFRGRAYTIPSGLSPQGHDVARGLLTFADAYPILKENGGDRWLALHVAGTMGYDKVPNHERLAWVQARREDWLRVDADPLGAGLDVWSTVKKPWQALAAILEWAGYLKAGEGYLSSLPVMVDGTCNGLQHLSAILRDREGAAMVNLVQSNAPQDIYAEIAEEWHKALAAIEEEGGEDGKKAASWFAWVGRDPDRASTKRQVMVLPYGGTKDAFFTYTRHHLDEVCPLPADVPKATHDYRTSVIALASKVLWAIVNDRLKGAMQVMAWLRECARLVAEGNQPIYWVAPSGFVVRHFYGLQKRRQVEVFLDGTRHQIVHYDTTRDLDVRSQVQGVAPNFIHSLDAAALAITANGCAARGITHLTAIHDAYGTHAAHMEKLSGLLREAFVAVHDRDVLGIFWAGCEDILTALHRARGATSEEAAATARRLRPALPPVGTLDIREVLRSPYFFS